MLPILNLQTFDSGRIAPKVGYVRLRPNESMSATVVEALMKKAADERFNLVWIQTYIELNSTAMDYRGTQLELRGDRDEALSRSRRAEPRFAIRELETESDWGYVEHLLQFSAHTRFSDDPHISVASVRSHKLAMLKYHVRDRHGAVAIAFAAGAQPQLAGYVCTSLSNDTIRMYELVVDPYLRTGFAAHNLIAHQLRRFALEFPDIRRVAVTIYQDNVASIRLFEKLGLRITGRPVHFYHYWPALRTE